MENKKRSRRDVPARRVGSLHIQKRVGVMRRCLYGPGLDEKPHGLGGVAYGYEGGTETFAAVQLRMSPLVFDHDKQPQPVQYLSPILAVAVSSPDV